MNLIDFNNYGLHQEFTDELKFEEYHQNNLSPPLLPLQQFRWKEIPAQINHD